LRPEPKHQSGASLIGWSFSPYPPPDHLSIRPGETTCPVRVQPTLVPGSSKAPHEPTPDFSLPFPLRGRRRLENGCAHKTRFMCFLWWSRVYLKYLSRGVDRVTNSRMLAALPSALDPLSFHLFLFSRFLFFWERADPHEWTSNPLFGRSCFSQ